MKKVYISGSLNKFGDEWYASLPEFGLYGVGTTQEEAFYDLKEQYKSRYGYSDYTEFEFTSYPIKTLFFMTVAIND